MSHENGGQSKAAPSTSKVEEEKTVQELNYEIADYINNYFGGKDTIDLSGTTVTHDGDKDYFNPFYAKNIIFV